MEDNNNTSDNTTEIITNQKELTEENVESTKPEKEKIKIKKWVWYVIAIGLIYNIYKIFGPSVTEEEEQNMEQYMDLDAEQFLKTKLGTYDDSLLMELGEGSDEFQEFLNEADIILKDSMDCDCPDVRERLSDNE